MTNQLNTRLVKALAFARRGNKAKALRIAEETLTEYAEKFLEYTWNSRIKHQLKKPKDLTEKEREKFKNKMVAEKLDGFKKIIDDL